MKLLRSILRKGFLVNPFQLLEYQIGGRTLYHLAAPAEKRIDYCGNCNGLINTMSEVIFLIVYFKNIYETFN